jgi:EAL domain-containing protein (putative c-di-GMP-specific phosphodiesterase class I)
VQGFLISQPLGAEEFIALVQKGQVL